MTNYSMFRAIVTEMEALTQFILHLGWLAVVAVIYAESGLLAGFFLPGDSLLFTAGFLVQQSILPINIHLFVTVLFFAAVLGDSTGYAFGHRVGRKLFSRRNSRFFRQENLRRAEEFYKKHGNKTIFIARFIPIVRTFAPIVAGASKMSYRHFVAYNIVGGLVWTSGFTYLGYFAGQGLQDVGLDVGYVAIIIIALSVTPIFLHAVANRERRSALKKSIKRELVILFSKRKP